MSSPPAPASSASPATGPVEVTRWLIPATFVVLLAVSLAAFFLGRDERGPSARISADGWYYHVYLVSLLGDGDLDFADEYARTGNWYRFGAGPTGRPVNPFGIGVALVHAPLFLAGGAIAALVSADTSGFGALHIRVTLLAAPLATLGALFFALRLLRRRLVSAHIALLAPLAILCAGPFVYYAVRQPGYAHPYATFFTAWLLDAWDRSYDRPRTATTWLGLGALLGATVLVRPQLATWAIVLAAAAADDVRRGAGRHVYLRWGAGLLAALAVFAPQLLAWKVLYGRFWVVPQGPGFMVWEDPRWSEVLFSARNGLFAWTPLLALAAVGLCASIRRTPRLSLLLLAGTGIQVFVNGAAWDWWGGGSYGGRRFDSCFTPFAYGLGVLLASRLLVVRAATVAATALSVAANLVYAARSHVFTLEEHGRAPVVRHLRARLPAPLADAAGALSWSVTSPARVAFALRHGAPLGAYDRVVGAHLLTEQYPGTGGRVRPREHLRLTGREPFLVGFDAGPGGARLRGERGVVLVPVNRRDGRILLRVEASAPVRAYWDGRPLAGNDVYALEPLERGVHELALEAPAGTVVRRLLLELPPEAPP